MNAAHPLAATLAQIHRLSLDGTLAEITPPADQPRYVVLKASVSRYAYVNDTVEGKTVKRYDILRGNGWEHAKRHASRLNELSAPTPNHHEADRK